MGKTATIVDSVALRNAINKAEENGPLTTVNEVWVKALENYNNTPGIVKRISLSLVASRAKEFGIPIKTEAKRGRRPIENTEPTTLDSTPTELRVIKPHTIVIDAPCGPCPIKLVSTEFEAVQVWANSIMEHGYQNSRKYTLFALRYWMGADFYPAYTPEYEIVAEHLMNVELV